ncbi:MAG: type II toxin-antitoxin system HicB family antitoxin [Desulfosporosinus sp.]|nr:type II toxin-antitoxin system HicB family antitoxin [Desulfosporosinus sp.]
MQRSFKVILEKNESGGFTVTVLSLPGCVTQGDNRKEALERIQEAMGGQIEALNLIGEPIPTGDVEFAEVRVIL